MVYYVNFNVTTVIVPKPLRFLIGGKSSFLLNVCLLLIVNARNLYSIHFVDCRCYDAQCRFALFFELLIICNFIATNSKCLV